MGVCLSCGEDRVEIRLQICHDPPAFTNLDIAWKDKAVQAFKIAVSFETLWIILVQWIEMSLLLHITLIQSLLFLQGEYYFELDDKFVLPGYPKLIQDKWGISGPIDAAFTRMNCQGQSYIFKVETSISIESGNSNCPY